MQNRRQKRRERRREKARRSNLKTPLSTSKKALYAALTTAGFFVLLELVLAAGGVEPASSIDDPYVGFASTVPLFVEESGADGNTYLVTSPGKAGWFNPQRFPKRKQAGTYRIFSLGGSATFGRPYDDATSFSGWLREFLNEADPSRDWEVINAGGISYASYRAAKVMEELVSYQPDLFIIYSGHNEFLEKRTYKKLTETPETVTAIGGLLSRTRIYAAGNNIIRRLGSSSSREADPTVLREEVNTILARSVGPHDYHRDDRFREQVIAHYRFNLDRMIDMAESAGAKVILVTPAANLKDCSPFKSEHSEGLNDDQIRRFQVLLGRGLKASDSGKWSEALEAFDQAAEIDPRYADVHYRRGRVLAELERRDEAEAAFEKALEEDVCPLRILPSMRRAITETAEEKGVTLIDFAGIVAARSEHGIPGSEFFLDHVHLTIDGYRLLALELMSALERENIFKPSENWNEASMQAVVERVEGSLDRRAHGIAARNLARVFAWAGKGEEAARLAAVAVESLEEDAELYNVLGRQALQRGDREEAIRYFRRVLEVAPDYADARITLGSELLEKGELEEAIEHFRDALRVQPDSPQAHGNLGLALASLGDSDQAIRHYREALRLDPAAAEIHSNLGVELAAVGRRKEAIQHFREALRLKPEHVDARSNLGLVLASQGKHEEAIHQYRQALDVDSNAAQVHFNLGVALQKTQRLKEAVEAYQQALRLDPAYAAAHYNLAIALVSLEKLGLARDHFRRANTIDPRYEVPKALSP